MGLTMTANQMAILQEVAALATAYAAEALGAFSGSSLTVQKVSFAAVPIEAVCLLAPPDELVVGIKLMQQSDSEGFLLAVIREPDALALVTALVGSCPESLAVLDELELSALCETGNILTASFLTALETHCGMNESPGPPSIAVDYGQAVLVDALLPLAEQFGEVLIAESDIAPLSGETPLTTSVQLIFSPSLPSWHRIFTAYTASRAAAAV